MKDLNSNWITEGLLDFEYKKYVLLAYLQSCRKSFNETKLYPPLGDLVRHYHNLHELNHSLEQLQNHFPKDLTGLDITKLKLEYERERTGEDHLKTLSDIMEFAMPTIKNAIGEGREIYELVEKNIEIQPLGIMPAYNQEGYLLIHEDTTADVHVYQYQHSIIVSTQENMRSFTLNYIYKESKSIVNTFEQIKLNLIQRFTELPNPAAYLCISKLRLPLLETLLPVTKRIMLTRVFP